PTGSIARPPSGGRASGGRSGGPRRSYRGARAGHARADDRRGRVLVRAMRLADLDLLEPGDLERGAELALGQRAGDAAGPGGHVGAGGFVHVRVRDDVRDGEAATGPE